MMMLRKETGVRAAFDTRSESGGAKESPENTPMRDVTARMDLHCV